MKLKYVFIITALVAGYITIQSNLLLNRLVAETNTEATVLAPALPEAPTPATPAAANPPAVNKKLIKRLDLKSEQTIYLSGPIQDVSSVVEEIKAKSKGNSDLYLLIDSPGGSVFDGALVISAMEASPARVHTICMQMCASMAFIIHQHGTTRLAIDRAILMAHPASGGVRGTLEQMSSRLNMVNVYVDKMNAYIANRMGISLLDFKAMTVSEFYVDSEDALKSKLLDGIVSTTTEGPNLSQLLQSSPQQIKQKLYFVW